MVMPDEAEERILKEIDRVRKEIGALSGKIDSLKDNDITDMKVEIATLKVKAGIWGLMGGMIPIGIAIIIQALRAGL